MTANLPKRRGTARIPDRHCELFGVSFGVDTMVINYRNQRGGLATEILTFTDGLVHAGHGAYLEAGKRL